MERATAANGQKTAAVGRKAQPEGSAPIEHGDMLILEPGSTRRARPRSGGSVNKKHERCTVDCSRVADAEGEGGRAAEESQEGGTVSDQGGPGGGV